MQDKRREKTSQGFRMPETKEDIYRLIDNTLLTFGGKDKAMRAYARQYFLRIVSLLNAGGVMRTREIREALGVPNTRVRATEAGEVYREMFAAVGYTLRKMVDANLLNVVSRFEGYTLNKFVWNAYVRHKEQELQTLKNKGGDNEAAI